MAQFVSAQELADRLGVEFTAAEEVRADALLTTVSGLLQDESRLSIERVEDDELTIRGSRETAILLPGRPVESVASVMLAGESVAESSWYLDGDELVRSGGWGSPADELVITYTHGHAEVPETVKAVVLEAAVRAWTNPASVVSERLGQAQLTYAVQGIPSGLLTPAEIRAVRRALGRRAGPHPIR